VQIATRSGAAAIFAKARSTEPRRFGSPVAALNVLHDVGITVGQFNASEWNPAEQGRNRQQPGPRRGDAQGAPSRCLYRLADRRDSSLYQRPPAKHSARPWEGVAKGTRRAVPEKGDCGIPYP